MPFEISDGKGSFLRAAGLASVGVAPEARGQGVANKLCLAAAGWAEKENFDLMLLYTGAVKVYEKSSWQIVQAPNCRILSASGNTSSVAGIWKHGSQLSSSEKSFIAECYNALPPLAGRVRRTEDERYFHSWEWTFRNPLNFWRVTADGYALKTDGFLSEAALPAESNTAAWQELISGVNQAFLAPQDAIAQELVKLNWNVHPVTAQPGCWHGEMAMQKLLKKSIAKEISFLFPLADKF
jgi:hypothetical protein